MTDVWSGEIQLPDGESIKDIGLSTHHAAASPLVPAEPLRFLATVDTAKIPLYLAAGPSYDVWTSNEASEAWFEGLLLNQPSPLPDVTDDGDVHEWWMLARAQSPIGVLVQVESHKEAVSKARITEILFYGTVAAAQPGVLPELRVHALPLSSDLLHQNTANSSLPPSPALSTVDHAGDIEARYLAPLHDINTTPKSPKRKRDLFEEATLAKRKANAKGGEGVAAAASRVTAHRKSISIDSKASVLPDSRPPSAHGLPRSRQLSRSPSITSDIRPLSRRETAETHARRSNLSRVDTISLQPEEPTTESRNKEALTKVVMAAMRMHGLQQRRKPKSRRASTAPGVEESQPTDQATAEDVEKDDEFKLIYHQTYKGAALALRNHITTAPLHAQPDKLRDLVEQFLTLFLTDPLAQPPPTEPVHTVATPGLKQAGIFTSTHHASPFDMPSGLRRPPMTRAQTDGGVCTGSPVSRRKTNEQALGRSDG